LCSRERLAWHKKKINNLPQSPPNIVKRKKPLETIDSLFADDNSPSVIILSGDPGTGKTELSKWYAFERQHQYHHIWFVQAEDWVSAYRRLALEWKLFTDEEIASKDIQEVVTGVHSEFSKTRLFGEKQSLIIFDNVPTEFFSLALQGRLPRNTDIIATSRDPEYTWSERIKHVLNLSDQKYTITLDEGVKILEQWIQPEHFDQTAAEKIVKKFNCLPVPIAQAGCFLKKSTNVPIQDYLSLFETNKKEILAQGRLPSMTSAAYFDIGVTLIMVIDSLEPKPREILKWCAYLPAKNIPLNLLEKLCGCSSLEFNKLLLKLGNLVTLDKKKEKLSIHDLYQEILCDEFSNEKETLLSSLTTFALEFKDFLQSTPRKAIAIYKQGLKGLPSRETNPSSAFWSNCIGVSYLNVGKPQKAFSYFIQCLATDLKFNILNRYSSIILMCNFADCSINLGFFQQALDLYLTTISLTKSCAFHKKQELYIQNLCLRGLGSAYAHLGKYREAIEVLKASLKTNESQETEPDLTNIATLITIGKCYIELGAIDQAENIYQKAIALTSRSDLENSFPTALILSNLGVCHTRRGEHKLALEFFKTAANIVATIPGKYNPNNAIFLNNVATAYQRMGEHKQALQYASKAIEDLKNVKSDVRPIKAAALNTLGLCLIGLEKREEAKSTLEKALEMRLVVYGEDHPLTAVVLNSFGTLYQSQEMDEKAIKYYKKALKIRESNLGFLHPDTAQTLESLCFCQNRSQQATNSARDLGQVYVARLTSFGETHHLTNETTTLIQKWANQMRAGKEDLEKTVNNSTTNHESAHR
jgi:tetratricopeptide (TPR) repeat protein